MSFVSLRGLSKTYGKTAIFADIDLDIEKGSICVLVGPSGCGKTTLLRAVAGLTRPDQGSVTIDGKDITHAEPKDRGIGMVFQHYALFPNLTVEQNLAFGLEQQRLAPAVVAKKIASMIELMGLGPRAKARPNLLSGGQKQRVALARALVLQPKLLLLDEPLSALDAQIRKRLREELKRLQREIGFTAIFVTHDQEEALLLGDKIGVMQHGRFEQVGTPTEIYNRPKSLSVARFIGDFNILAPKDIGVVFGHNTALNWAVHPQAMEIVRAPTKKQLNGSFYATQARIVTENILGTVIRYTTSAHGHTLKVDVLNTPEIAPLKVGDSIWLRVSRANLCEIPTEPTTEG